MHQVQRKAKLAFGMVLFRGTVKSELQAFDHSLTVNQLLPQTEKTQSGNTITSQRFIVMSGGIYKHV